MNNKGSPLEPAKENGNDTEVARELLVFYVQVSENTETMSVN